MANKKVLLIIGGGIAAYKCLGLIRLLRKGGIDVSVILTRAGAEFVTPLSISALSGEKVYSELFDPGDEVQMGHIELSRAADIVLVAPATADLMAKAANGLANDLASTCLLATDKPVLMAPAMNVRMWEHAATTRNVQRLQADGISMIGPDDGHMACGEFGPGRMAEPETMLAAIHQNLFQAKKPLAGKRALITAGPTHEPIDPVRVLANRSSGKQGFAIARALAQAGAEVTLVHGPVSIPIPEQVGITARPVETARQMLAASMEALPADIAIFSAAVADWRVKNNAGQKLKKQTDGKLPKLELIENPDILASIGKLEAAMRPDLVIGFAAETENVAENAKLKLLRKKCDWLLANDVSGDVMGGDDNKVIFFESNKMTRWPKMRKQAVADKLVASICASFTSQD